MKTAMHILAVIIIASGCLLIASPTAAATPAETYAEEAAETETITEEAEASAELTVLEWIVFIFSAVLGAIVSLGFWLLLRG